MLLITRKVSLHNGLLTGKLNVEIAVRSEFSQRLYILLASSASFSFLFFSSAPAQVHRCLGRRSSLPMDTIFL